MGKNGWKLVKMDEQVLNIGKICWTNLLLKCCSGEMGAEWLSLGCLFNSCIVSLSKFILNCSWHSDGHWLLECHLWTVNPKKNLLRTRAQHLPRQAGLRLCQLAYPVAASHSRHHGWFLGEKPFGNWILHEIHYIHCSIPCRHCRISSRPTQCPGWIKPQVTRRFHKILTLIPTDYEYSSHIVIKLGVKPISRAWNYINKNHKASAAITELPVCHALHKSAMARQRANVLRQWELNPRYSAIQGVQGIWSILIYDQLSLV